MCRFINADAAEYSRFAALSLDNTALVCLTVFGAREENCFNLAEEIEENVEVYFE